MPTPTEIKKALLAASFEVYRTRGETVHVAERVRENLMMDSGVYVESSTPPGASPPAALTVGFLVRAQRSDFPNDSDDQLFARARELGIPALDNGYEELNAEIRSVVDPGDANHILDRWCEVTYTTHVADLDAAMNAVRYALPLEKAVVPR